MARSTKVILPKERRENKERVAAVELHAVLEGRETSPSCVASARRRRVDSK